MSSTFHLQPKLYRLTFDDGSDLDGFACTLKGVSLDEFLSLSMAADELKTPAGRTKENVEAQFATLAGLITAWNLADDNDKPVPVSYDELKAFDYSYVNKILRAYMRALSAVPKDSSSGSPSGGKSEEEQLGLGA
jgi:hypothetical protein